MTTNPSLISKEPKQNFDKLIKDIADYCSKKNLSLSVEVFATEPDQMINQARDIAKSHKDLVDASLLKIKIPMKYLI